MPARIERPGVKRMEDWMRKALRVAVVSARPAISHQLAAALYSLRDDGTGRDLP
jgi:hypothetical protein